MARALISVSEDGFTYLTLNGATSRYSDTGQAMTYLGDYARETATSLPVTIDDGNQEVEVLLDETGKIAPASSSSSSSSSPATEDASEDEATTASAMDSAAAEAETAGHGDEAETAGYGDEAGTEAGSAEDYPWEHRSPDPPHRRRR